VRLSYAELAASYQFVSQELGLEDEITAQRMI